MFVCMTYVAQAQRVDKYAYGEQSHGCATFNVFLMFWGQTKVKTF